MGDCPHSGEMSRRKQCKVLGCDAIIGADCSRYQQKKRVCAEHLRADAVRCKKGGDELYRFCQQCGKLERLERFQGKKRSCRMSLAKRRSSSSIHDNRSADVEPTAACQRWNLRRTSTGIASNSSSDASGTTSSEEAGLVPLCAAATAAAAAAAAPISQPSAAAAAALLAEAWCAADSAIDFHMESLVEADEEYLMMMLEHELLAAAAEMAVAPAAAAPAAVTGLQLPLQLQQPTPAHIERGQTGCCGVTKCNEAAPAVMPAAAEATAAAVPANPGARLQALTAQVAALQAELVLLQDMHAMTQQLNASAWQDASCTSFAFFPQQQY